MSKLTSKVRRPRHLSSNEPVVFFMQALIVVVVIFMVSYLIFAFIWGAQRKVVRVQETVQAEVGVVDTTIIEKGIDESQFLTEPNGQIDKLKIQGLFPEIK